jgi:hypothetical protein
MLCARYEEHEDPASRASQPLAAFGDTRRHLPTDKDRRREMFVKGVSHVRDAMRSHRPR